MINKKILVMEDYNKKNMKIISFINYITDGAILLMKSTTAKLTNQT